MYDEFSPKDYNLGVHYLNKYVIDWSGHITNPYKDKEPGYFSGLGFATWSHINAPLCGSCNDDCIYFYLRLYHNKRKALSNIHKFGLTMVDKNYRKALFLKKVGNILIDIWKKDMPIYKRIIYGDVCFAISEAEHKVYSQTNYRELENILNNTYPFNQFLKLKIDNEVKLTAYTNITALVLDFNDKYKDKFEDAITLMKLSGF